MNKGKRIIALAGAIFLAVIYLAALILAFIDHPSAHNLFVGAIVSTVVVPVLLYLYMLLYKLSSKKDE